MSTTEPLWGLPDPDTNADFYDGTTAKRFMAWLVDTLLIFLVSLVILPFTGFLALFVYAGFFTVVSFCYRTFSLANHSATPGLRLMGVEFRDRNGERFDMSTAAAHTTIYLLSWFVFPLRLISVLMMMFTPRGQGLQDMLLGTAGINRAAD